jgi:glycosidase
MKRLFVILLVLAGLMPGWAQKKGSKPSASPVFEHVEPPFWWTSMKNRTLQVLLHSSKVNISEYTVTLNYPGVALTEVRKTANPHYLFLYLTLQADVKAGMVPMEFALGKKKFTYTYELKDKPARSPLAPLDASDVVYLLMPDRFANGDPKNDTISGMFEGAHRDKPNGRHGGDLKGISDHLGYFNELGVTAMWLNPVLENNQPRWSYHGYAITDLYKVDARFGTNEEYRTLIAQGHAMGIKMIQDMVMNHLGNESYLVKDLPDKDWLHNFPEFTRSNFRGSAMSDPYASKEDVDRMNGGWFDNHMPDLNQKNPMLATYLIQNSLWWIGYAGLDGIRMDTYPYPDKEFMSAWARTVLEEFPGFYLVGEVWINAVPTSAYWQKGMVNRDGYQSFLPSITDFPMHGAIPAALNEKEGYDTGLARLYFLLSQDFIYPDANSLLTFLDNHDLTRFFNTVGKDPAKFKLGLTFLLTSRGIPQLYYATELMMDGDASSHPDIRRDFPGGWKEDKVNAFTGDGLTPEQKDALALTKELLNWRKNNPTFKGGRLVHFVPENNVYVYFRIKGNDRVMVVLNGSEKEVTLSTARFRECLSGVTAGTDVITGNTLSDLSSLRLGPRSALVLELR